MSTLNMRHVGRTTFHVEWAMKWVDHCVADLLAKPFDWNFREISSSGIRKGSPVAVEGITSRDLKAQVKIIGKTGLTQIEAMVDYVGEESVWYAFQTEMKNSDLSLRQITIEVTADTGESMKYTFAENEIPGYESCMLASV